MLFFMSILSKVTCLFTDSPIPHPPPQYKSERVETLSISYTTLNPWDTEHVVNNKYLLNEVTNLVCKLILLFRLYKGHKDMLSTHI